MAVAVAEAVAAEGRLGNYGKGQRETAAEDGRGGGRKKFQLPPVCVSSARRLS